MKLSDKTKLQVIAKDDSEFKIRVLALLKLENDPKLFPLVDYTHDLHSRSIALEILNNKVVNGEERLGPVITYVSMYDPNPEIRARAKYYYSRLSAYSSFGTVIGIR